MTIKEARKLLGKNFGSMSDEDLRDAITQMETMARDFLEEC